MVLYKYLRPERLDVLETKSIRFTQPAAFNDPFEFRPYLQAVATAEYVQAFTDANFERALNEKLDEFPMLEQLIPRDVVMRAMSPWKAMAPELIHIIERGLLPGFSASIDAAFNSNVGVLCLSEIRDSLLMWGHYTDSHEGFVVGLDSTHAFFSKRRSEEDEFGFLRQVEYRHERPKETLSSASSSAWFQTKPDEWKYEKEWRIMRVLSDAQHRKEMAPHPMCLFEFPADAVLEIIIGLRSSTSLVERLRTLAANFPRAFLFRAFENPTEYGLLIKQA